VINLKVAMRLVDDSASISVRATRYRMRRREFIAGASGAVAWRVARAQQPAMPVVGFLNGRQTALRWGLCIANSATVLGSRLRR